MPGYLASKGHAVLANGYAVIPIKPGTKRPDLTGWRNTEATPKMLNGWLANGRANHGLGILTKWSPAVDIDVLDRDGAEHMTNFVQLQHNFPLVRVGQPPKRSILFRSEVPFRKLSSRWYIDDKGRECHVEVLGDGQQSVAFHIHPDTRKPYRWIGDSPETTPHHELELLTQEGAETIIAEFHRYAELRGWKTKALATSATKNSVSNDELDELDINTDRIGLSETEIRRFLMAIPNDSRFNARDDWLKIGFAIGHETEKSDFGHDLFREWSEQHPSHSEELLEKFWESTEKRQEEFKGVSFRYIIKLAKDLDTRPKIILEAGELPRIVTEAEDALILGSAPIYSRGQHLVRPIVETVDSMAGQKTKAARLVTMTEAGLTDWFSRTAKWERFDARAKKRVLTDPPPKVAMTLLSRDGEWRVPPLSGVITTATIREDGSLLISEGYDPQTRLLLMQPPPMPAIPPKPTRRDALRALTLLSGLLSEFPFKNGDSLSVGLSILMTPVCRGAIPVAPLHLVRAPTPGSGKSYLVHTASAIATGEMCPAMAAASEEETEKRLGACLLAGQALISIDNLSGELKGDFLCQAVEQRRPQVRVLGKSERVTIENRTTIFATGNNPTVHGDMVRRTLVCSLDPKVERPELREFHRNPLHRITRNRGEYVAAILTIVRAYLAAGEPCKTQPLNSFEQWSRLIREPLMWLGCDDPIKTIEESREEDPVLNSLRQFLGAWRDTIGTNMQPMTSSEIISAAYTSDDFESIDMTPLQLAITTVVGGHGDVSKRLGQWLKASKDRIVNGLVIEGRMDGHKKVYTWYVKSDEL